MHEPGHINGYSDFCRLLAAGDARAHLLLLVQDLHLRCIVPDPWSGEGLLTDVDSFLDRLARIARTGTLDRLDHIEAHTKEAVRHLLGHLHEEIVRTHTQLPIGSVREVDTATLIWLSRLPGRTVKEKLSGKRRIKAVTRNWIQDTLENRLFKAFLQNLRERQELKEKSLGLEGRRNSDNVREAVNAWLNGDGREISRYDHLPPNNRLLSDKQYRKIWDAWNWLGELDRRVAEDAARLDTRVAEALFWEVAAIIRGNAAAAIIQLPVLTSIHRLEARPVWPQSSRGALSTVLLEGSARGPASALPLKLELADGALEIRCGDATLRAVCSGSELEITDTAQPDRKTHFCGRNAIRDAARHLARTLPVRKPARRKKNHCKAAYIAADIARIKPRLFSGDGSEMEFSGRLLGQYMDCGQGIGRVFVDCSSARGLLLSADSQLIMGEDMFRHADATGGDMARAAASFFELLADQLECQTFQFLTPDDIDDFSLNLSRRQANLHFRDARTLPRSIGALFAFLQDTPAFCPEDECLVIVGSVLGTHVILTPLLGRKNQELMTKMPESGGFLWERHPSISFPAKYLATGVEYILGKNAASTPGGGAFSPQDIRDCAEELTLFYEDGASLRPFHLGRRHGEAAEKSLEKYKLRLEINKFRNLLGLSAAVRCYYLAADCPMLNLDAPDEADVLGSAISVKGAAFLAGLEAHAGCPALWRDHIPDLFMRVSSSEKGVPEDIPLVKNDAIMPRYGETKVINKGIRFTLPAGGAQRYHFPLTKKEGGSKIRYEALIQSPHFPLASDLPCTLEMTYTYGAEYPFQLLFLPERTSGWRHGPLRAEWVNAGEIRRESPVPPEPPVTSWADLRRMPGPRGESDLVDRLIDGFDVLHSLREMHSFWEQRHLGSKSLVDRSGKTFKRVCISGFVAKASWKTNTKGNRFCFINVGSTPVYINEKLWIDTENQITSSDEIVLDIYENDDRPGYSAKNIHAGNIKKYEEWLPWKIAYPTIQIWRDGRSLSDPDAPQELREAAAHFIEDMEYFRDTHAFSDDFWSRLCLYAARMHRDGPAFLRGGLLETIQEQAPGHGECVLLGSLLGDLSLPEQRRIHEILLASCVKKPWYLPPFRALAIAWWRVPAIVHTIGAEDLKELTGAVGQAFTNLLQKPDENWFDRNASVLCELVLAMLRTRGSNDLEIRSILDANGRVARKLAEKIDQLVDIHARKPLTMNSFLQLKADKPAVRRSLPDLLYATQMYLTGEDGAGEIVITGIDEE